jgi:hypothetical protein
MWVSDSPQIPTDIALAYVGPGADPSSGSNPMTVMLTASGELERSAAFAGRMISTGNWMGISTDQGD